MTSRMKLPNAREAFVDIRKLKEYCLSHEHPRGRHKARVFLSSLGMTVVHAAELRSELLARVRVEDCIEAGSDQYGNRYIVDFRYVRGVKAATLRSTWIIKTGEEFPRLTSCFVL